MDTENSGRVGLHTSTLPMAQKKSFNNSFQLMAKEITKKK